jgi:hypothetical protein
MKRRRIALPELALGSEPFRLIGDTLEAAPTAPCIVLDGLNTADLPDSTGELI